MILKNPKIKIAFGRPRIRNAIFSWNGGSIRYNVHSHLNWQLEEEYQHSSVCLLYAFPEGSRSPICSKTFSKKKTRADHIKSTSAKVKLHANISTSLLFLGYTETFIVYLEDWKATVYVLWVLRFTSGNPAIIESVTVDQL